VINRVVELTAQRKDGTTLPVELAVSVTGRGKRARFSAFIRDISERKRFERERGLLASIVDSSDEAIYTCGIDGIVTSWNPGAERLFGYRAAEIVGHPFSMLIPDDRRSESNDLIALLVKAGSVQRLVTTRRRKDGSLVDVALWLSLMRDPAGQVMGAAVSAHDISRERGAQETRSLLASIVEFSDDAILSLTPDGTITSWNPGATRLFGYSSDEMVGQSIYVIVPAARLSEREGIVE